MEYESIKRVGLDHYNVDMLKSYEIYDSTQNNHIIYLFLNKDFNIKCPLCNSTFIQVKGTKNAKLKYSCACENNITIHFHRTV